MTGDSEDNSNITGNYYETDSLRILEFRHENRTAVITQNRHGYAMLSVKLTPDAEELERYYGFDMALDHVAELLGVNHHELPIPKNAKDMGM